MKVAQDILPYWVFAGAMFGLVSIRLTKDNPEHNIPSLIFAIAFVVLLPPVWLVLRMIKGWRYRHPRKIMVA